MYWKRNEYAMAKYVKLLLKIKVRKQDVNAFILFIYMYRAEKTLKIQLF